MTKQKTLVHFITAIVFVIFGITLFRIASGELSLDYALKESGAQDRSTLTAFVIPFVLCILSLAGLICILQDADSWLPWLESAGAILAISVIGYFIHYSGMVVLLAGIYFLWWAIASIRNLISIWYDLETWENWVLLVARLLIVATLFLTVCVAIHMPNVPLPETGGLTPTLKTNCTWAGILAIATAVGLVFEGILWRRNCDY